MKKMKRVSISAGALAANLGCDGRTGADRRGFL